MPPINDHFHFCRSTFFYVKDIDNIYNSDYNDLEIPKINKHIKLLLKDYNLNSNIKKLFNKYLTDENIIIDNNNLKPMYYNIDKDKIIINPKHEDLKYYDLNESLTHEIIHMIDNRNNIILKNQDFIEMQINNANDFIMNNKEKYYNLFMNDKNYENNMTISDIFSAVTNNEIKGSFYHDSSKWKIHSIKYSEVVSNIITADITNNKYALKLIKEIKPLDNIRERIIKNYEII